MIKYVFIFSLLLISCDVHHEVPDIICENQNIKETHTMTQVLEMAGYGITTFESEIIVAGYVVSSDASGNMYKILSIQDAPRNPMVGIQFSIDKSNLYAHYPVGRKVFVKLKGLSIGYARGVLQIGKAVAGEIERIPSSEIFNHFIRSCEVESVEPEPIQISQINESHLQKLVMLENVQFGEEDIGESFGDVTSTKNKERQLYQVNDGCDVVGKIKINISGFSDFKNFEIPNRKGNVQGVLTKYYSEFQLSLRDENDVKLTDERCSIIRSTVATISYQEIISKYTDEVVEFGVDENYVFEGYVISSDQEGNFANTLYIQDEFESPEGGFKILIDEENLFEKFSVGDKVYLELNYLYLDKVNGQFSIGIFDEGTVGPIKEGNLDRYIQTVAENYEIIPIERRLDELTLEKYQNTLVTVQGVQLKKNEIGKAFAYFSGTESASRKFSACEEFHFIELETFGSASFANNKVPIKKGEITGVLYRKGEQLKMQIRSLEDVEFDQDYETCEEVEINILITEVADPENNIGSRFVELYNAGDSAVSLNGWKLKKYLNGSSNASSGGVDLSGYIMEAKEFFIIANEGFEVDFDMTADFVTNYISGNGDDVYELEDSDGQVHDVYGVRGEDGSGTNWEYLDGKAVRKLEVDSASNHFDLSEWEIFSKTSGHKQLSPQNFSPWIR